MNTGKLRQGAGTILFMVAVTFLFTSAVTLTNLATRDMVAANEELFLQRAVLFAAAVTVSPDDDAVRRAFAARIRVVRNAAGAVDHYRVMAPPSLEPVGFVLPCEGAGLWGTIEAVVGLGSDGATLTGFDVIRQNETPGLGGRIDEDWFREQFRGKRGPFTMAPEGSKSGQGQFDAITGATITSTAIRTMLNRLVASAPERLARSEGRP